ncbi:MAG: TIGR01548 family HAD-type hydrolase [Candidatus Solibacter sp.]
MSLPLIVFDMDGVLVDVTESYRESIVQTVKHFTGKTVSREAIQDLKNEGGWNDDWKLSHHLITQAGHAIEFETVRDQFQKIFLGDGSDGLILREEWVAKPGTFEALAGKYEFAVFTGRPKTDAQITLDRFGRGLVFNPVIGMYDVENHKPHPEGLLRILADNPGRTVYYVGDTVDDARCARAARVPFIGIAAPSNPRYIDLVFLFQAEKPFAIIDDINYLCEVLEG